MLGFLFDVIRFCLGLVGFVFIVKTTADVIDDILK